MPNNQKGLNQIYIEGATIFGKNFEGKISDFNTNGRRTFNLKLEPDFAEMLFNDGWAVKQFVPHGEENPVFYLPVEVKYNHFEKYDSEESERLRQKYNPKVYLVTENKKTLLDETNIANVDKVWINCVNVRINPYFWKVGSKSGIKAYLDKMYVMIKDPDDIVIKEDPMDAPFIGIPEGELNIE